MSAAPILSIGIPTYNGAATIRQTLESVVAQLLPGVEIVISDNASTDETQVIAREFAAARPDAIRYYRNDTNIGMDRNFDAVVRRAAGRFVWILSDDDHIVHPQAVSKILAMASAHLDAGTIFANYENEAVPILRDYDSLSGDEFFRVTRFKSTLISSVIVNRALWCSYDLTGYAGTYWTHIGYLIRAAATNKSCIIADALLKQIIYVQKERRWGASGTFILVGVNLAKIYAGLGAFGYAPETVRAARRYAKERTCSGILLAKVLGLRATRSLLKDTIAVYHAYPSFWLFDLPLLLTPCWLLRSIHRAYQLLRYGPSRPPLRG